MSEPNEPTTGKRSDEAAEEDEVRRLLTGAGPRPEIPPEDLAAIKAAFRAEWEEHLRRRRVRPAPASANRLPGGRLLALAAALLVALGIAWWLSPLGPPAGAGPLARVESVAGSVTVRVGAEGATAPAARLGTGAELAAGAEIETAGAGEAAAGRAALRLAGGPSLRLDAGSRVRLLSASVVRLERGAVYVDSGPEPGGGGPARQALAVETLLGVATEVGTQFEVRLLAGDGAMRVRVREGRVQLEREGGTGAGASRSAVAGVELTLHADGSVTEGPVALHGAPWQWVLAAAPPLAIEGMTLEDFLGWVGRETGWTIRYAEVGLKERAGSVVVHGTIHHLTPEEAPGVVLPGAGLEHEVVGGELLIRAARGPRER